MRVEESRSVRFAALLTQKRNQGQKIIGFNVGEPDLPTPEPIVAAVKNAIDRGETRYSLVAGLIELRLLIKQKMKRDQDLNVDMDQIMVGNGSKHLLYALFQVICAEDDEILIPVPYWVSFPEMVKLAGAKPVLVPTRDNLLYAEDVEEMITPKTRAIVLNNPNNPTGEIYSEEEIKKIMALAKKHDFYVISDEAYEGLVYSGNKFTTPAKLGDEKLERTIIVQSFSKTFCMTGFRLGYAIGPTSIISPLIKLQSHLSGNTAPFIQAAGVEALRKKDEILPPLIEIFEKRRDLAYKLLSSFTKVSRAPGAFYLFPNIEQYLGERFQSDEELAEYILEEANVAVLPGSYYGKPGFLRLCFCTSTEEIEKGI
jgi:aspartate aminotransferase